MPLVDAALAFAITMLAVATVVTKIVEFLHWLLQNGPALLAAVLRKWLGERVTLFKQMVDEFVQKDLERIVVEELHMDEAQTRAAVAEAVQQIKQRFPDGENLIHMSNTALLEELKLTDLGKKIVALNDRSVLVFNEISRRYTNIEKKYTTIFRQNARKVATIVAIVLAVAFNIDCVNIVETYLHNPTLSATIAATSDKALADYTAQIAALPGDPTAEEFRKQYEARQKNLSDLNAAGFPFGWSYFPYGPTPPKTWSRTDSASDSQPWRSYWTVWVAWIIGLAFTVGLAGLGAPFWFDVIRKLTELTRGGSSTTTTATGTTITTGTSATGASIMQTTTTAGSSTAETTTSAATPSPPTMP